jgi:hypothetical protein
VAIKKKKPGSLSQINVIGFIGAAGTGKSRRAQLLAREKKVDYVIDDGLVVSKGRIMIGKSAKSEKNLIKAIRRALFQFPDHRQEVINFLLNHSPCKVMIIATSESMANKISRNLGISPPSSYIFITDVATPEEISTAVRERMQNGHHVIPVSHAQIRKNFGGKLVGHLKELWKSKEQHDGERTIVRPPFSFLGNLKIDIMAISQISEHVTKITTQVKKVDEVKVRTSDEKLIITITIRVKLDGRNIVQLAKLVQKRIISAISYFTGMEIGSVNVEIEEVLFE